MSYILNIETSTKNCSVSLSKNGNCLIIKEIAEENYSHAEQLHNFISNVLKENEINFQDLDAVAISKGPGSYTGLRIGVSAAKGLCFALDIPLIAIDTLTVLAQQVQIDNAFIVPVLDARRLEIYCTVLNQNYETITPVNAHILTDNSFLEYSNPLIFIGDCVQKCQEIIKLPNAQFIHSYPSAKDMCTLSYQKFLNKEFENTAYFEPFYLKDFILG
jgi:tRNA threonylcarbamoyladenosine biosynthesis protein TsaB